mgnify:CR=1 FL=1
MSRSAIPSNFITAGEVSAKLEKLGFEVSAERILELSESGHLPHWRWCFDEAERYLYRFPEIKDWFREHHLMHVKGVPFPDLTVLADPGGIGTPAERERVPECIRTLWESLRVAPVSRIPGVYFLISKGEVVYVGQSVNVYSRITSHKSRDEYKRYDEALFLPVPKSDLNDLEVALIHALKPRYNRKSMTKVEPDIIEKRLIQRYERAAGTPRAKYAKYAE